VGPVTDRASLSEVLTEFACLLVTEYQVSDALHDLVEGVTDVLAVTGAGVSLVDGEEIKFATAGTGPITVLERVQEQAQDGPCIVAYRLGQPVLVSDLADETDRWPALREAAMAAGIAAVAGIPMSLKGTKLGALNLYHGARREWSDEDVDTARLLAAVGTAYLANAARLDQFRHTTEQLQEALNSRVIIEQAKGILAGERKTSVDEAFKRLRGHARRYHTSLRAVAEAVVNIGLRP
jgi:GAF domain-containing protein